MGCEGDYFGCWKRGARRCPGEQENIWKGSLGAAVIRSRSFCVLRTRTNVYLAMFTDNRQRNYSSFLIVRS